jgi:hypothetical protein
MKPQTLDKLAWTLIYAGAFVAIVGGFVGDASMPIAVTCWTVGGVAIALGLVAIVLRSRKGPST